MTLILQMASLSHQVVGEPHERNRKWVRVNFQKSQFWAHDSWDGRPTQKESQHTCSCRRPPSLEPTNGWKQHVLTYGSIVGWLASKNHGDQPPVRVDICHRPQYAHTLPMHRMCTIQEAVSQFNSDTPSQKQAYALTKPCAQTIRNLIQPSHAITCFGKFAQSYSELLLLFLEHSQKHTWSISSSHCCWYCNSNFVVSRPLFSMFTPPGGGGSNPTPLWRINSLMGYPQPKSLCALI